MNYAVFSRFSTHYIRSLRENPGQSRTHLISARMTKERILCMTQLVEFWSIFQVGTASNRNLLHGTCPQNKQMFCEENIFRTVYRSNRNCNFQNTVTNNAKFYGVCLDSGAQTTVIEMKQGNSHCRLIEAKFKEAEMDTHIRLETMCEDL